ncbi:MAG: restriction endonuclease subunit S [Veillonellaceae bacterium]|nr:restriction endonuclease subunit S [Veillonellaceae bacterium]
MREMKDSGIEWIGEIPKDWVCCKVKNATSFVGSGTTPTSSNQEFYDGDISWIQSGDLYKAVAVESVEKKLTLKALKSFSALHIYRAPFIVMAMYGASVGNTAFSKIDACCNQACCCIKNNEFFNLNFMYYWLILAQIDFLGRAIGGTQPNISQEKIRNQHIVKPSLEEQQQIADYLDTQCSEIDATAEDIQKEISLLEDYKKSVITEAVTKGLNPDAEMKDSGIEWIGEIPKYWKVDKIKYHLKRNEPKNPGNAIVLSVYRDYGVIPKDSRDDNHNVTSEDTSKYKYVKKGQLVINKMKAWQGSLAVSDYDGIVSPAYFIYDFIDEEYNHKYFHYLVRSCYKEEFKRISGGIREGQWDLSPEGFSNTMVLLPSIEEQNEILDYILQKEMEIDPLIADKKRQLDILADYKKSLIYEYVTGKKEVPVNE